LAVSGALTATGTATLTGSTVTVAVAGAPGSLVGTGAVPWAGLTAALAVTRGSGQFAHFQSVEVMMPLVDVSRKVELVTIAATADRTTTRLDL
jgi:hypothetical protein